MIEISLGKEVVFHEEIQIKGVELQVGHEKTLTIVRCFLRKMNKKLKKLEEYAIVI